MPTHADILGALLQTLIALIEVMHFAHNMHDEEQFQLAHKQALELGFKIQQLVENQAPHNNMIKNPSCPLCPLWLKVHIPC